MMPAKNNDLHGNVPDKASVALLFIDLINDLEFEGGQALAAQSHGDCRQSGGTAPAREGRRHTDHLCQ